MVCTAYLLARPVVAAFETDRINVVTAAEIDVNDLSHAPKDLQGLSWFWRASCWVT